MKKNGKKDMLSGSKEESEHFAKILMEKMDSTVKTVTEQYGGLVKKIDSISSDVSDLKEDMAIMKPALERNCKDMLEVKSDMQEVKKDMREVKNDMREVKKDMREVKSEVHSVKMVVTAISRETNDHEKRIKRVEEKVFV